MTHQEILTKAIEKAVAGGWSGSGLVDNQDYYLLLEVSAFDVIFNHDFSRALWSERMVAQDDVATIFADPSYPNWMYHLQQMVIADDPIAYLGEHL